MASFTAKKVGKGREGAKIKIVFPFRSYPTGNIKLQRVASFQAKIPLWLHFKPKLDGKGRLKRENKNYPSVPYQPDA